MPDNTLRGVLSGIYVLLSGGRQKKYCFLYKIINNTDYKFS